LHKNFQKVLDFLLAGFLYGIMVQVRFPYVGFSARGRPLKRYCSFTTKYGPPGDLFARSKIPQGSPI
ncbi:MAG: hypothetical protein ACLT1D_10220, partial [[Clostridium] symbiosum]